MSYEYSKAITHSLESFGAKTFGSLDRRQERLQRFIDLQNKKYAKEIQQEEARTNVREEQEEHINKRVKELRQDVEVPTATSVYNLRSRSDPEYGLKLLIRAIENGYVTTRRG